MFMPDERGNRQTRRFVYERSITLFEMRPSVFFVIPSGGCEESFLERFKKSKTEAPPSNRMRGIAVGNFSR